MKSLEQNKPDPYDNDDFDEDTDSIRIPGDIDIQEGDEEPDDETDLPPAMPPGA